MDLLYRNDQKGKYPESWYAATVDPLQQFGELSGKVSANVCVVGGGFTGLSAALHLAERGFDVKLVEAHRVGFGASGRNGGQLGSGQRIGQDNLETLLGLADARKLWDLAENAKDLVKDLVAQHDIDCHFRPGIAHACFSNREVIDEHAYADHLKNIYGYSQIKKLHRDQLHAICPSPKYVGGSLDMGAGHLHPLAFALGLAKVAHATGVRIYEKTRVINIKRGSKITVQTEKGQITTDQLVLACNGYLGSLDKQVAAKVMPINNFIVATEPLGKEKVKVLAQDYAVADSKFVINYFRLSHDNRLLFGGGETYGYRFPSDIAAVVRKPMSKIFPHLSEVRIDYAWGGTLAITRKRLPYLRKIAPNIISASGYSGHGVGTATHAGQLIAMALGGEAEGFDTMARIPASPFPGGIKLRSPLLTMAMTWFALRDRLGI
ncbi:NAD(P)/FAD-dependent oxidoreductase [Pseudopelagicola sp. nBUS_19]|uniref:NAD(P)/FAD-dependent oxidoreductase n=1 Tax=Pseudopelagicola sp. nBUS_19 TaxID=3395316 RepID=UPI003EBEA918